MAWMNSSNGKGQYMDYSVQIASTAIMTYWQSPRTRKPVDRVKQDLKNVENNIVKSSDQAKRDMAKGASHPMMGKK